MTSVLLYLLQITAFYEISNSNSIITVYCDNQEVVSKATHAHDKLRGTSRFISADYDIECLLRQTIKTAPFTCSFEWVKGHQDEEGEDLDYSAKLNIAADELAEFAYTECEATQASFEPFQATTASLLIDGIRVTSKMKRQIEDAIHIPKLKQYRIKKYGWSEGTWKLLTGKAMKCP